MELNVPADLADFVSTKLMSGEFQSAEDLAIAALRWRRDEELRELAELRASIEEARREEGIDISDPEAFRAHFEEVIRLGQEELAKRGASCGG